MKVGRFLQTPKGTLLLLLLGLVSVGAWHEGWQRVLPGIGTATAAAFFIDGTILRVWKGRWVFPDGALLSALIVAMILSPAEPWYVPAATSALSVVSKYVFRSGTANVFNPAALALVVAYYVFGTAQDWWGALPEMPVGVALLFASGVFMASRVDKIPLILWFLGCYFLLDTATALAGFPESVAELFRTPDLQAALFFAFFMVTDPPTSPPKHPDQPLYAIIVALGSFIAFEFLGTVYFLLAGLLAANVWESLRRARARSRKRVKVGVLAAENS